MGWGEAAAAAAVSPDWVSAGTVAGAVAVVGTIGGAIAWVKVQLDRREDSRSTEERRLDELHRDDRDWWAKRLGVVEMEADHRATLAAVENAHRTQLADQHAEHMLEIRGLRGQLDRVMRATEIRGLRHRRWDENVRRDIVAMGGRDPGDPPALYETDGETVGEWVEDPPTAGDGPDLPRRRAGDVDEDEPAGP